MSTAKVPPPDSKNTKKASEVGIRIRVISQIIPNPIGYIDLLCAREVVGNTPRPSKVKNLFFNGMRLLDSRPAQAETHLKEAVKQANIALGGSSASKVPKIDIERMAYALMGLGYVLIVKGVLERAEQCYKRSYMFWSKLHGKNSPLLIPILCDVCILEILCNIKDAPKFAAVIMKINAASLKKSNSSWINAYSITRLASVASGQKGIELRQPLKDGQKRVVLPPEMIRRLYKTSVDYMQQNMKSDSEEHVKTKTQLALSLYKQYITKKPKTSDKSTTTTTTTTTTEPTESTTKEVIKKEDTEAKDTTTETKQPTTTKEEPPSKKEQQELDQSLSKKLEVS